jgi:hypothetical protein
MNIHGNIFILTSIIHAYIFSHLLLGTKEKPVNYESYINYEEKLIMKNQIDKTDKIPIFDDHFLKSKKSKPVKSRTKTVKRRNNFI